MARFWPILVAVLTLSVSFDPVFAQFRGPFGPRGGDFDRDRDRDDDRDHDRDQNDERDRDGDRDGDENRRGDWGRGDWGRGRDGGDGGERPSWRWGGDGGRSFGPPGGFGSGRSGFGPPGGFGGFGPPGGSGGPSGGGFRPDPGAFFDRLDRDGDGRLGGDEVENMPGFFRGMLDRAGVGEGASREDFTRGFERLREERERRESGDDNRSGDRNSSDRSVYKPAEREPVTLDLPDTFRDRDLDGDNQIGLYEWREWDRTSIDQFFLLDANGDGFLTPKELVTATGEAPNGNERRGETRSSSTGSSGGFDENDPEVRRGRQFFGMLDANRDGRVNPDEWSASRRLRLQFEEAGARLDRDMSENDFLATYLKTVRR